MKRSEINRLIEETKALQHQHHIQLPPFAYWRPTDWKKKGPECDEIRQCHLGLTVFTVRNGAPRDQGLQRQDVL